MHATQPFRLESRLVHPAALRQVRDGSLLGVVSFGATGIEEPGAAVVRVPLERLEPNGREQAVEAWLSLDPEARVAVERRGDLELARDERVLFGQFRAPAAGSRLEPTTLDAYLSLLTAIDAAGYPHLLRVWASVPAINREDAGLERYKAFCRARAAAFEKAWGSGFTRRLPASTAVGSDPDGADGAGDLVVHFLAARAPGAHVENPRQVAAYDYPDIYGPRSPSFARATLAPAELGTLLFVSGTASIVGHASVHRHLADQARETVRNLERVREAAEEGRGRFGWSLLKVYLRRRADYGEARSLLAGLFPSPVPTLFLHADVCRRELLIEIEAVARPV